ncbi:hypothetical protein FN846DRAFT_893272 [Sphaerosporella brunnea]|uniref:Uncharacterized protein n=1 Tax=Sphaerosporella brunnea TaxID=1250544 RepID=A0A5J5EMM1_9PEZI|nr:hypothetical protein FN846DRAFT_893272 [Sphaerosporella brunnea]
MNERPRVIGAHHPVDEACRLASYQRAKLHVIDNFNCETLLSWHDGLVHLFSEGAGDSNEPADHERLGQEKDNCAVENETQVGFSQHRSAEATTLDDLTIGRTLLRDEGNREEIDARSYDGLTRLQRIDDGLSREFSGTTNSVERASTTIDEIAEGGGEPQAIWEGRELEGENGDSTGKKPADDENPSSIEENYRMRIGEYRWHGPGEASLDPRDKDSLVRCGSQTFWGSTPAAAS